MKQILLYKKKLFFYFAAGIILISFFLLYSNYRQQYVGACDYYGYYQEALLLKSGKIEFDTGLDPKKYHSSAPLGFFVYNEKVVPQYPPGYPILLALASYLGAEFYVNPLIGVLSIALIFLIILKLTNDIRVASFFSVLWGISPIVAWGSTYVMSDLVAAFFLMLGFYLLLLEKPGASAIVLAFSIMVRPTNVLFLIALLPFLIAKRQWLRFGLHFFFPAMIYGVFNWINYGAPWRFGYGNFLKHFLSSSFLPNLLFYLKEIIVQFSPFIAILVIYALFKRVKYYWLYSLWLFSFLILYSFWRFGGDAWWWSRFLLPAFPALFFLAALGLKEILDSIQRKWNNKKIQPLCSIILIIIAVPLGIYFYNFAKKGYVYRKDKAYDYYVIGNAIKRTVPPNSLVGGYETSGAINLYGNLQMFNWHNMDAPLLIKNKLRRGIPVYFVIEIWHHENIFIKRIFERFHCKPIKNIDIKPSNFIKTNNWLFQITGLKNPPKKKRKKGNRRRKKSKKL